MDAFPDVVRVESAGTCTFRCRHCLTGQAPNSRGLLRPERYADILSQFVEARFIPRVMVLYHGGEPLLNKRLESFIEDAERIGVLKTVITTNASLLNGERAKGLVKAHLDELKVSFDGESSEENNWIRRNADFQRDAGNVKLLLQMKREMRVEHPSVKISNIRICDEHEVDRLSGTVLVPFPETPAYLLDFFSEHLSEVEFQSYPAMVWPGYEARDPFHVHPFPPRNPKYCGPLFETITILANGDVVPCCLDIGGKLVLGNVFQQSIFDIWASEAYVNLREGFREGRYHALCLECREVVPKALVRKKHTQLQ